MKTERIKVGEVYMAVVKGREVRVKIDHIQLDYIVGTNIDERRGIACPASKIVAGPLKIRG